VRIGYLAICVTWDNRSNRDKKGKAEKEHVRVSSSLTESRDFWLLVSMR
jgi:hypothetical protein